MANLQSLAANMRNLSGMGSIAGLQNIQSLALSNMQKGQENKIFMGKREASETDSHSEDEETYNMIDSMSPGSRHGGPSGFTQSSFKRLKKVIPVSFNLAQSDNKGPKAKALVNIQFESKAQLFQRLESLIENDQNGKSNDDSKSGLGGLKRNTSYNSRMSQFGANGSGKDSKFSYKPVSLSKLNNYQSADARFHLIQSVF